MFVTNLLWCLWKARNEQLFMGTSKNPQAILAQALAMGISIPLHQRMIQQERIEKIVVPRGNRVILLDASWDTSEKTGTAFVIYNNQGSLQAVYANHTSCTDPLQAEAMALLQVLTFLENEGGLDGSRGTLICSDCSVLVQGVLQNSFLDLPSWQAAEKIAEGVQRYGNMQRITTLRHVNRKSLKQPHNLANWARTTNGIATRTVPVFVAQRAELNVEIDLDFF